MNKDYSVSTLLKILSISLLPFIAIPAYSYTVEWSNSKYTHFSKEEPLKEMLKAMASDQDVPIVISDKIKDTISGYYRERTASDILDEVKHTYDLITYFDGITLYVYKKHEVKQSTLVLQKTPIVSLEYELIKTGVLDKNNKKLRWKIDRASNTATFNGPKRFLEIVHSVANRLDNNQKVNIYKWKTSDGKVNFSTNPPFNTNYKRVMTVPMPKVAVNKNSVDNVDNKGKVEK